MSVGSKLSFRNRSEEQLETTGAIRSYLEQNQVTRGRKQYFMFFFLSSADTGLAD